MNIQLEALLGDKPQRGQPTVKVSDCLICSNSEVIISNLNLDELCTI